MNEVLIRRDSGGSALAERLRALGFAAQTIVCTSRLRTLLAPTAGAPRPRRAVLLGTDLPEETLTRTLATLSEPFAAGRAMGVAVGPPPARALSLRLQEAGFALALYEPFTTATLRFQLNRAFLHTRPSGATRCGLRAPVDWRAAVKVGKRSKAVTLYDLSQGGAFLETPRPSLRGVDVRLELPLPGGTRTLDATVVHTNVPGNMKHPYMPYGMGIRFGALPQPLAQELAILIDRESEALMV